MSFAVYCVMALRLSVPCQLPEPVAHEPQAFHYGKATDRSWPSQIRTLRPYPPSQYPIIGKRPEKPVSSRGEVLAAYAEPKGLARAVTRNWKGKSLFVKSDGNEQTECLHKNKRLWSAMQKIRSHFGRHLIIESAYRSPEYNAALRKRSKGVARNSYHMRCAAIDFRVPGVSIPKLARYVRSLPEVGGIGTYRSWVHIDTGRRRYW